MQQGFPKRGIEIIAGASDPEITSEDETRITNTRTAEELIALGDRHFERYSDEEMNVLFQHLRESSMTMSEYDEDEWVMFQVCLRGIGVPITVLPEYLKLEASPSLPQLSMLFHTLWTKNRKRYRKELWRVFRKQLSIRGIYV